MSWNPDTVFRSKWPKRRFGDQCYMSLVVSYLEVVHAQAICEGVPPGRL